MRVALVHDWIVARRGGERVLEALAELFPDAELFTLLYDAERGPPSLRTRRVHASLLNRLAPIRRHHRPFLPLFPAAIESLDLSGFELVISSSHCVAKGVRIPAGARHLSYVHAPMRYMWDRFDDYFGPGRASLPVQLSARALRPWLQRWDRRSASRVDRFVANSHYIAGRIAQHYGRTAQVVYPPVELERFSGPDAPGGGEGGYFLWMGAFAPYKRLDVALEAFRRTGLPLWIVGSGQDEAKVRGPLPSNIRFRGAALDAEIPALYRHARALVFPGEEDFGITPLEAQASGRPVIALARGGALETVTPETGLLYRDPGVDGLVGALEAFPVFERRFDPVKAREQAALFTRRRFQDGIRAEVDALLHTPRPV